MNLTNVNLRFLSNLYIHLSVSESFEMSGSLRIHEAELNIPESCFSVWV